MGQSTCSKCEFTEENDRIHSTNQTTSGSSRDCHQLEFHVDYLSTQVKRFMLLYMSELETLKQEATDNHAETHSHFCEKKDNCQRCEFFKRELDRREKAKRRFAKLPPGMVFEYPPAIPHI